MEKEKLRVKESTVVGLFEGLSKEDADKLKEYEAQYCRKTANERKSFGRIGRTYRYSKMSDHRYGIALRRMRFSIEQKEDSKDHFLCLKRVYHGNVWDDDVDVVEFNLSKILKENKNIDLSFVDILGRTERFFDNGVGVKIHFMFYYRDKKSFAMCKSKGYIVVMRDRQNFE